jgi:hypothetical protein
VVLFFKKNAPIEILERNVLFDLLHIIAVRVPFIVFTRGKKILYTQVVQCKSNQDNKNEKRITLLSQTMHHYVGSRSSTVGEKNSWCINLDRQILIKRLKITEIYSSVAI